MAENEQIVFSEGRVDRDQSEDTNISRVKDQELFSSHVSFAMSYRTMTVSAMNVVLSISKGDVNLFSLE